MLADIATGCTDCAGYETVAVIVLLLNPNDILLLFENTRLASVVLCVPAEIVADEFPAALIEAVIVLPFKPKLTPLEFENTMFVRFWLVVPPLKFTLPAPPPPEKDAVSVEPLSPKLTPFEFDKISVPAVRVCVPAPMALIALPIVVLPKDTTFIFILPLLSNTCIILN